MERVDVQVTEAALASVMEGVFGPIPGRPSRIRPPADDAEYLRLTEGIFGPRRGAGVRPRTAAEWDELTEAAYGPRPAEDPDMDAMHRSLRVIFGPLPGRMS